MAKITAGIGLRKGHKGVNKKTSIGFGNVKLSTMNKSKKASFKKYRGQGK